MDTLKQFTSMLNADPNVGGDFKKAVENKIPVKCICRNHFEASNCNRLCGHGEEIEPGYNDSNYASPIL